MSIGAISCIILALAGIIGTNTLYTECAKGLTVFVSLIPSDFGLFSWQKPTRIPTKSTIRILGIMPMVGQKIMQRLRRLSDLSLSAENY
jgi:hypothetical protein